MRPTKSSAKNTSPIQLICGGDENGLLGLTINKQITCKKTGHCFIPPINPHCCEIVHWHDSDQELWQLYSATVNALKIQLVDVFDDIYTSDLNHALLGYVPVLTLQELSYLYNTWDNTTITILDKGTEKMKAPLDLTRPISHIWMQIQQGQALVNTARQRFTEP
eukprot:15366320-Ditylum_brightwellii.AAC.1